MYQNSGIHVFIANHRLGKHIIQRKSYDRRAAVECAESGEREEG
jgi:hypothetical protein